MATTKFTPPATPVSFSPEGRAYLDEQMRRIGVLLNDSALASEDETISGDWTFTGAVDLSGATISGLSSDDLSDVSSIAMLDENETVTGNWAFSGAVDIDTPLRVSDGASDYIDREVSASGSFVQDLTTGIASMVWDSSDATLSGYYWQFNNATKMQLSSVGQLYLPNTSDVGLSSTDHAFQIGPPSGYNIRMDNNELMVVNNGAAADLQLNADGGNVQVNLNTAGGLYVNRGGPVRVYDQDNTEYGALICKNNAATSGHETSIDCTHGGKFRIQSTAIADDATATFDVGSSYAIVWILTTYNATTYAHLGLANVNAPVDYGSGSLVSVGSSNPDIDGRVNVWVGTSGTLSIKNRLGSSRSFYVFSLEP